jgi:hypothetical protein
VPAIDAILDRAEFLRTGTADTFLQSDLTNAEFGICVAGAGDVNGDGYSDVIVGAATYQSAPDRSGAAFVFLGGPSGIANGSPATASAIITRGMPGNGFLGESVAGAGDVNGDGFDDIVVGSQLEQSYVFHGGPLGIATQTTATANAILVGGYSVSPAGDVNGDGYADIVTGDPTIGIGQNLEGAAYVFQGGPSGIGGIPNATLQSNQAGAYLGWYVSGAGDVNNDGFSDVIVGAPYYGDGQSQEGAAFVFHGGPTGIGSGNPTSANATLQSDQAGAFLGWSVAGAGDVNNDGWDDVIVGAPFFDVGQPDFDEGAAGLWHGGPAGIASGSLSAANALLLGDRFDCRLGYSVASALDFNSDGYSDVIVGASSCDAGQDDEGAAFVFRGSAVGVGSRSAFAASASLQADQAYASFGHSVNGTGDVNGDGFADIIVGSVFYTAGQSRGGAAFVYLGAPNGDATCGVYASNSGAFFLRNSNSAGPAAFVHTFGAADGGYVPLVGDWDGNGSDTVGLYNSILGTFFLSNRNAPGPADLVFGYGPAGLGWKPIVGDWDGNGRDSVGLYDPTSGFFFLKNNNSPGSADFVYGFGPGGAGWIPLSGDFDGDGISTVALYDGTGSTFFLRNSHAPGPADMIVGFGPPEAGWIPLCGDFDGDGISTFGLYDPAIGFFFLRNIHAPGPADLVVGYGPPGATPLVGDWDGV